MGAKPGYIIHKNLDIKDWFCRINSVAQDRDSVKKGLFIDAILPSSSSKAKLASGHSSKFIQATAANLNIKKSIIYL